MKVIGLFSGCGGMDLGFIKAGAEVVWANDIDSDAVNTYKRNIGEHIVCKDIYDVDVNEVPNNADIIVGGFPCLGFTVAKGKSRNINDKVNFLYKEYIRILESKLTKYFVIENVMGMKSGKDFNNFFENMIKEFEAVGKDSETTNFKGYKVKHSVLKASDYGVPQNRKRVIVYGVRGDIEDEPNFPNATHMDKTKDKSLECGLHYKTLKDAISDLPLEFDESIPNHIGNTHKVKINAYVGNRQLDWDKPSPTITGRGSRTGGAVIHPHPNLHRRLTVREVARIQTFGDDFIFEGSKGAQYAHIGNAVPPIMAFHIAKEFKKVIDKEEVKFNSKDWDLPWLK